MSLPLLTFQAPERMTPAERRTEIIALLSRGLGRFVADLPKRSQRALPTTDKSLETSLNQLDTGAR